MWRCLAISSVLILQLVSSTGADEIADSINRVDQLIKQSPDSAEAYVLRGRLHARSRKHDKAIADFTRAIELDPASSQAYDERGSEHLIAGQIDESIADFDKFLSAHPQHEPHHWKRGIAYYYAGKFKDGTKQFDDHQTVNPNDVENAVWRYLCMARDQKLEKATASLLPIKGDTRVPMMELYELYAGRGTEKQVMAAVEAGDPSKEELNVRRFYAHLYLGLFHEAAGDKRLAKEHLTMAADKHEISHYMWDIARMHVDRQYKAKPADAGAKNPAN
jgi:lipoprotein NlpI